MLAFFFVHHLPAVTYPLGSLMGSDKQLNHPGQGSMLSERGVIGGAKGQIPAVGRTDGDRRSVTLTMNMKCRQDGT